MSDQTQTLAPGAPWHDPIIQELHDIRAQLMEKYHGDMSAYSRAATAHAHALGFRVGLKDPGPHGSKTQGLMAKTAKAKPANSANSGG